MSDVGGSGSGAGSGRRDFLKLSIVGTATALGVASAFPAVAFLNPSHRRPSGSALAGKLAEFPAGTARIVLLGERPALVIRLSDGKFRAFVAVCTHLGCLVRYSVDNKRIECPCHTAVFDLDGHNVSGPAPRPLEPLKVSVEDGAVIVSAGST